MAERCQALEPANGGFELQIVKMPFGYGTKTLKQSVYKHFKLRFNNIKIGMSNI